MPPGTSATSINLSDIAHVRECRSIVFSYLDVKYANVAYRGQGHSVIHAQSSLQPVGTNSVRHHIAYLQDNPLPKNELHRRLDCPSRW